MICLLASVRRQNFTLLVVVAGSSSNVDPLRRSRGLRTGLAPSLHGSMPTTLDYSKWDKLEISDDEFEGTGPPPPKEPEGGPEPRFENQLDDVREQIRVDFEAALTKLDDSKKVRPRFFFPRARVSS